MNMCFALYNDNAIENRHAATSGILSFSMLSLRPRVTMAYKVYKAILKKARTEMSVPIKRQTWRTFLLFLWHRKAKWQRVASKMDSPSRKYTGKLLRRASVRETWNVHIKILSSTFGRYVPKGNAQRGRYAVNWTEHAMKIMSPTNTKVPPQLDSMPSDVLGSTKDFLLTRKHSRE